MLCNAMNIWGQMFYTAPVRRTVLAEGPKSRERKGDWDRTPKGRFQHCMLLNKRDHHRPSMEILSQNEIVFP